jgi:hypothetical protein
MIVNRWATAGTQLKTLLTGREYLEYKALEQDESHNIPFESRTTEKLLKPVKLHKGCLSHHLLATRIESCASSGKRTVVGELILSSFPLQLSKEIKP